jgi:hypothetical protein
MGNDDPRLRRLRLYRVSSKVKASIHAGVISDRVGAKPPSGGFKLEECCTSTALSGVKKRFDFCNAVQRIRRTWISSSPA